MPERRFAILGLRDTKRFLFSEKLTVLSMLFDFPKNNSVYLNNKSKLKRQKTENLKQFITINIISHDEVQKTVKKATTNERNEKETHIDPTRI